MCILHWVSTVNGLSWAFRRCSSVCAFVSGPLTVRLLLVFCCEQLLEALRWGLYVHVFVWTKASQECGVCHGVGVELLVVGSSHSGLRVALLQTAGQTLLCLWLLPVICCSCGIRSPFASQLLSPLQLPASRFLLPLQVALHLVGRSSLDDDALEQDPSRFKAC